MNVMTADARLSTISGQQWMILLTVQLSTLLFGMTITLANVVLPQIRGAMSATPGRDRLGRHLESRRHRRRDADDRLAGQAASAGAT